MEAELIVPARCARDLVYALQEHLKRRAPHTVEANESTSTDITRWELVGTGHRQHRVVGNCRAGGGLPSEAHLIASVEAYGLQRELQSYSLRGVTASRHLYALSVGTYSDGRGRLYVSDLQTSERFSPGTIAGAVTHSDIDWWLYEEPPEVRSPEGPWSLAWPPAEEARAAEEVYAALRSE